MMESPDSTTPSSSKSREVAGGNNNNDKVNEGLKNLLESNKETPPTERPSSPEPNCVICLERVQNKSFTDSCFHQFCYVCILEWSKVKAECPLCKQSFKSIIHSVVSMDNYEQYYVPTPPPPDPSDSPDDDFMRSLRLYDWGLLPSATGRPNDNVEPTTAFAQRLRAFRQRSFLTFHNYYQPGSVSAGSGTGSNDIWGNFRSQFGLANMDYSSSTNRAYSSALRRVFDPESSDAWHVCQGDCPVHRRSTQGDEENRGAEEDRGRSSHTYQRYRQRREASSREFRRYVYTRGLYAKSPPPDSRKRSTDPNFFSCNPACVHRLVPWLNRELGVLLHEREDIMSTVLREILTLIKQVPIRSRDFYNAMRKHFLGRTIQFIHELDSFATSPHDTLATWDSRVQHERRRPRVEERPLPGEDDDGIGDSSSSSDEEDGGFPWRSTTPTSDEELERLARSQRRRGERRNGEDAERRRRDDGGNENDDVENANEDSANAVTPRRMTGRERTPGGDERREMNESSSRNRRSRRPSTPYRPPPRENSSTNATDAAAITSSSIRRIDDDEDDAADNARRRNNLNPNRFDDDVPTGSATSQSGWETPPWSSSSPSSRLTQLSPSLASLKSEKLKKPKAKVDLSPSHSDVEVVGYVKPLADRTPVEVTLSSDDLDSDVDADVILECRKKRRREDPPPPRPSREKRLQLFRRLPQPTPPPPEVERKEEAAEDRVVDVDAEDEIRSMSKWSTASSNSSSSSSKQRRRARDHRREKRRKKERNDRVELSTEKSGGNRLSAFVSDSGEDSDVREVLRKSGNILNTEVIIGDSDDDNDDDVIIESEGRQRFTLDPIKLQRSNNRHDDSSSSSSTQATGAASSVIKAKVWDFLESARREREVIDRARNEGKKDNRGWDAEEEEEKEEEDRRRRRFSIDEGAKSKSPRKKNSGSASSSSSTTTTTTTTSATSVTAMATAMAAKGKGKGKGKSSTRKSEEIGEGERGRGEREGGGDRDTTLAIVEDSTIIEDDVRSTGSVESVIPSASSLYLDSYSDDNEEETPLSNPFPSTPSSPSKTPKLKSVVVYNNLTASEGSMDDEEKEGEESKKRERKMKRRSDGEESSMSCKKRGSKKRERSEEEEGKAKKAKKEKRKKAKGNRLEKAEKRRIQLEKAKSKRMKI